MHGRSLPRSSQDHKDLSSLQTWEVPKWVLAADSVRSQEDVSIFGICFVLRKFPPQRIVPERPLVRPKV